MSSVLDRFSAATREWFTNAFPAPTAAQLGAWEAVSGGAHALVVAPTGSGKTLAAFLWAIDQLASSPPPDDPQHRTRVLYISPLKALGVDVERNLRSPLVGVTQTARRLGLPAPDVTVGVRSGDTTSQERRMLLRRPPDILITTPESLYLMLTSAARETLVGVDTVIVDEVHAVAATKRGAHLAVSLERLDALLPKPAQRIGLSATVRPQEEVARFLGGLAPVSIVAPPSPKTFDLSVVVPVEDMTELGTTSAEGTDAQGSIWPHVEEEIVDQVLQHRSTIVFANSRRLAERLTARLNEIYEERLGEPVAEPEALLAAVGGPPAAIMGQSGATSGAEPLLARAHHGSVSKDQRAVIEDDLKSGRLRCVVATSSLELGIDMGAVDLVIQVESPPSVASGLQRIGRAGHQVGEISKGVLMPQHRADLIHVTVVSERMTSGLIEQMTVPQNPLDILAQQTVAAVALEPLDIEDWFDTVRRSAPFATLPRSAYEATLDLLSGRYPSDEFAELRPRIVWDRVTGQLTGRPGAQRLAVTSGGTIPDRGLFGVFMVGAAASSSAGGRGGGRVGELDEEMVYESRVGDVFALGTTSWRIEEITHDRVMVSPAFGQPGRVPFWKGDTLGRPAELGRAIGAFTRDMADSPVEERPTKSAASQNPSARTRLANIGLDKRAANNLLAFVADQKKATGHVPTDKTLVVERFRDELGDWRVILHSPYGMKVHAPWALAVGARVRERYSFDGAAMAGDDGIVVRLPETDAEPPGAELFVFEASELSDLVTAEVGGSALFASRFRECAARALLLPRYNPGRRSPLWQQRQKASQLLEVARKFPSFPIVLETVREVLQDVYDLPALTELAGEIASRRIRIVETETEQASPFARSLLFGYVAAFMYEGDSPLAERRAAALSLDPTLLAELLGRAELRELLDAGVIEQTERELQRLVEDRKAKDAEGIVDLVRLLGPLTLEEIRQRTVPAIAEDTAGLQRVLDDLARSNRVLPVQIAGSPRWAVIEDASRLRDALGVALPIGVPSAFVEPVPDPVGDLISRYARTHGPFTVADAATRFGLGQAVVLDTLRRLAADRRVTEGEFRPDATGSEWVDAEILRRLRSRSLAALRHEVEPVSPDTLARFLPEWQQVGGRLTGIDGLVQVIDQLAGVPLPASSWESLVLPARLKNYSPAWLDELTTTGEVLWAGAGSLAGNDGWVSLHLAESAHLTLPLPEPDTELPGVRLVETAEGEPIGVSTGDPVQEAILQALSPGGAFFFRQLAGTVGSAIGLIDDKDLATALWDLVWAGQVTNDTFAPLRSQIGGVVRTRQPRARAYRGRGRLSMPSQSGPPTVSGRWSLLPPVEQSTTLRAAATAERLLERYGVVTRGAVMAEGVPGGFSLVYKVLRGFEESGRARRGYFVEGLGAAQFATGPTIDRLRRFSREPEDVDASSPREPVAITLAATDPANPFGAALPWPATEGHRPGRKAGALVVIVDGQLTLYVERGGKTVLSFTDVALDAASASLAQTVRAGLGRMRIEKIDGEFAIGTDLGDALQRAGFVPTPQGLRLRA
ncbi:ATP-dependent helicase [Salinibacterium sp. ZJ450]|uniref:ATP-dependent helicase n=1 Tax=Salinibacterium sp. ZJ450 TaxID=2708338 RepID=UPI00141E214B|nr:ATP-dependent helicase [Salinibacterium sp. ZJ450]